MIFDMRCLACKYCFIVLILSLLVRKHLIDNDVGQWRRNYGCAGCWCTPMYVLVSMFNYY